MVIDNRPGANFNVGMDLEPFRRINPCGHAGLEMTQLADLGGPRTVAAAALDLAPRLARALGLGWDGVWSGGRMPE